MPTTPEAIAADIAEAATAGFRGRLIARGQARAIIWRDGTLPPDAPGFAPQLSYDLHSYAYALLGLGLRLRELGGDVGQARTAFEQAATALEAVMAKGNRHEADRDFHFVMAAAAYHLAHLSARAYSLLAIVESDENFSPLERTLAQLMRRNFGALRTSLHTELEHALNLRSKMSETTSGGDAYERQSLTQRINEIRKELEEESEKWDKSSQESQSIMIDQDFRTGAIKVLPSTSGAPSSE